MSLNKTVCQKLLCSPGMDFPKAVNSRWWIFYRATRPFNHWMNHPMMFTELNNSLASIYVPPWFVWSSSMITREKVTSGSCKRLLVAIFRPPAQGRSLQYLGHSRWCRASSACGTWPRSADSGSPGRRRRDFARLSQNSPPGPPAWSTCNQSRCTTGNWSANRITHKYTYYTISNEKISPLVQRNTNTKQLGDVNYMKNKSEYIVRRIKI